MEMLLIFVIGSLWILLWHVARWGVRIVMAAIFAKLIEKRLAGLKEQLQKDKPKSNNG